jgi:hypothetical protein
MKVGALGVGSIKSLGCLEIGPVATVHMQKSEIKYKKPGLQDIARHDLPLRNASREGVTRNIVRRSPKVWCSGGRTPTFAPRVGGRLFPGNSTRADRRLIHSRIFFHTPRVLSALSRSKLSPAFECKHRCGPDGYQCIANERDFTANTRTDSWSPEMASPSELRTVDLFSCVPRPRGRSNFRGLGAGPVDSCPIFLRKIPEIFFLGTAYVEKRIEEIEKVSQINDGAFPKTSRNSVGGGVAQ